MSDNEEFNLEETLKKDVDNILKNIIVFDPKSEDDIVSNMDIDPPSVIKEKYDRIKEKEQEKYEDPLKKFEDKNDYELTLSELNEKISLLKIRCGHYYITHNFDKCLELELELEFLLEIRDRVMPKDKEGCFN